jgi:hypothetical protein
MRYKVEENMVSGWDDPEWTIDGQPERFNSIEEAEEAIAQFIRDTKEAVALGHMEEEYFRENFRIVPVEQKRPPGVRGVWGR